MKIIRQIVGAFSLTACAVSLVFFAYVISKIKNLNPYLIFAISTAKVLISQKFREILILMFFSTFLFFAAYFVKHFMEIRVLYWLLEASSLLLFLVAGFIGAITTLRGKTNVPPRKTMKERKQHKTVKPV
jgi:hypothetical protein